MIDSIEIPTAMLGPTAILGFSIMSSWKMYLRFRRPYCYFRLSVVFSITWEHFHWTHRDRIVVGISTLFIIVPEIYNYFRFGWPYCYFQLSVVVVIIWGTSFKFVMVENPGVQLETNTFVVLLLKLVGAFLPPSATRVRKNRSAIGGLSIVLLDNTALFIRHKRR